MATAFHRAAWSGLKRCAPHLLLVLVVLLPFAAGLLSGQTFYFRDIARAFYPARLYAVRGLLQGELRFWNSLVHEGIPLFPPPVSYPMDLLQVLMPSNHGLSLLLVLHVPLGALAMLGLARRVFRLSSAAALAAGLIYALGGFYLSCLNHYVHLLAAAWAPIIIWSVLWSTDGALRRILLPALATAVGLSTSGVEIVAQAVLCAAALAIARSRGRAALLIRLFLIAIFAAALAAPVLLPVSANLEGSERASRFTTDVVLSNSIYPLSLLQTLIADWHGPLIDLVNHFWGGNFFPVFPYYLSLYLGAAAICLAATGALERKKVVWPLILLALLGLWVALGRWSGLSLLVERVPQLHLFRFPVKAFFTVHLCISLLAASALHELEAGRRSAWRTLLIAGAFLGSGLVALPLLPRILPRLALRFAQGLFPPGYSLPARIQSLGHVVHDASIGGVLILLVGALAVAVLMRRLSPSRAAALVVAVVAVDLLRTGAGLNPMVSSDRLRASPEMEWLAAAVRAQGGRLFSCDPELNPAYFRARAAIKRHSLWTFMVFNETLTPSFNMNLDVPTAMSRDLTMMAPENRVLSTDTVGCAAQSLDDLLQELRLAGVSHVVSIAPLGHPDLLPVRTLSPKSVPQLSLHLFSLKNSAPTRFVARQVRSVSTPEEALAFGRKRDFLLARGAAVEKLGFETHDAQGEVLSLVERSDRIEIDVRADRRTVVCVRDGFARGWNAVVNGRPTPILRANGRHRAIPVEAGVSRLELTYQPPLLKNGLASMAAALLICSVWLLPAERRAIATMTRSFVWIGRRFVQILNPEDRAP